VNTKLGFPEEHYQRLNYDSKDCSTDFIAIGLDQEQRGIRELWKHGNRRALLLVLSLLLLFCDDLAVVGLKRNRVALLACALVFVSDFLLEVLMQVVSYHVIEDVPEWNLLRKIDACF
jgi:hypothetical protein